MEEKGGRGTEKFTLVSYKMLDSKYTLDRYSERKMIDYKFRYINSHIQDVVSKLFL